MGQANLSDIVENQTAAAPSTPSRPPGTASFSDIVENQTANQPPAPPASDYLTKTEDFIHSAARIPGAAASAVSRFVDDQKASGGAMGALKRYTQSHANHSAILSGVVDLNDKLKAAGLNELADSLTRGISTALITGAGGISPESVPSLPKAPPDTVPAADPAAEAASRLRVNPFRAIVKGKAVAQEPAIAAVRGGVAAGAPDVAAGVQAAPILKGSETILDEPLSALATKAKAAYKQIDDTVGFDLKELKTQLGNDQYNLQQLGNTTADVAQRKALQASITDSTQRIAQAEAKLRTAGIDPKAGDVLFKAGQAGADFKNVLVRATKADGTVDVDKLVTQSKALRFGRRGDRLAQYMGQGNAAAGQKAADEYMNQITAAQQAGVKAMRMQRIAEWVGGIIGAGTAVGAGKQLMEP